MNLIKNSVKRSKLYEDTLQSLAHNDANMFPTLREAQTFCAILGFSERRKEPLDQTAGVEDIAPGQYLENEAVDIIFAIALADYGHTDILLPDKEKDCIKIYEEYANGGLRIVQTWIDTFATKDVQDAVWRGLKSINFKDPDTTNGQPEMVDPTFDV